VTELTARVPTTEQTRDDLKTLVDKSDTAGRYEDLLQEIIDEREG